MSNDNRSQSKTPSRPANMMRPGRGHGMRFEKAKNVKGTTRRLIGYLRPHQATLIVVFVLATFGTTMSLIGP